MWKGGEMTLTIALLLLAFLWLSHRLHDAYVHAVSREERKMRPQWYSRLRNGSRELAGRPNSHLGPKLFLIADFAAACGLAWTLCQLHPSTREFAWSDPQGLVRCLAAASLILGAWLVLEGRHLQRFYQHMMRSVKVLRGDAERFAFEDELLGPEAGMRRPLLLAALSWTAIPHLALLLGFDPVARANSSIELLTLLLVWVAAPLGILSIAVGGYLLRLRTTLYS
jgi:hypothetical protein